VTAGQAVGAPERAGWWAPRGVAGGWLRSGWALVAVAGVFTLAQVAAVSLRMPLGWDETVYVSQFGTRAPAAYFSAPRARGITWLAAPAVLASDSTVVLRCWMSLLAAVGLVAAYWPWRRVAGGRVAVVAAGLFAGLWVVQFYAGEVMPNLYVALGTVCAAGWLMRALHADRPAWRETAAAAGGMAFVALMRPPDAAWAAVVLVPAALLVRGRRRPGVAAGVGAGAAVGLVPWVIEAYQHFGGPLTRLRAGSDIQGGIGWHVAVGMELRAVNGPMLCRPCTSGWHQPLLSLWWVAMPLLAAGGVWLTVRRRRRWRGLAHGMRGGGDGAGRRGGAGGPADRGGPGPIGPAPVRDERPGAPEAVVVKPAPVPAGGAPRAHEAAPGPVPLVGGVVLAAVGGAVTAVQYLLLLDYAATRFLMPTYALLVLPVAAFLVLLPGALPRGWRVGGAGVLVGCVVVHLAGQYVVVRHQAAGQERGRSATVRLAAHLNAVGLRPPCTLIGPTVPPLAFYAHCESAALTGHNDTLTLRQLPDLARRRRLAAAQHSAAPPSYARGWVHCRYVLPGGGTWHLWRPPAVPPAAPIRC
jgi:hypothetical protein